MLVDMTNLDVDTLLVMGYLASKVGCLEECLYSCLNLRYSVVFETILFALTVMAMLSHDRCHSFSTLTLILYRDGMPILCVIL